MLKKRELVRSDRKIGRIAEHFFSDEDVSSGRSELLPPPPVEDELDDPLAGELAEKLEKESVDDEHELLQVDPMAVIERRKELGEISQVIALQAGVGSEKKRIGLGLIVILSFIGALGGLAALAFNQGWFTSKGALEGSQPQNNDGQAGGLANYDLPGTEAGRIRDSIWRIEPKKRHGANGQVNGRTPRPRGPASAGQKKKTQEEKDLLAFYESQNNEKKEVGPRVPRGLDLAAMGIDMSTSGGDPLAMSTPGMSKVEVVPDKRGPATGPGRLTNVQIRMVIRRHARPVKKCLEKQLKRDPSVSGKLLVIARVKPNGKVQRVRIEPPKFHGTYLQECLLKEVKRWTFPSFEGEAYDLTFPYALSAQQTY